MVAVPSLRAQTSIAAALTARDRTGVGTASVIAAEDKVAAQPAASLQDALAAAFAGAGVVFAGEVVSIDRAADAVIVRWRVEDAVRGVVAGSIYQQREWPGLWAEGNARYSAGERALVMLHATSVGGYASPVADGIVPLRGNAVTGTLDLRWMAQQVAVTDAARLRPMLALRAAGGDFTASDALLTRTAQASNVPRARGLQRLPAGDDGNATGGIAGVLAPPSTATADDPNAHVDGAMILGMLHAWQRGAMARP